MYRSPLTKQSPLKHTAVSNNLFESTQKRVPTAPLKTRAKIGATGVTNIKDIASMTNKKDNSSIPMYPERIKQQPTTFASKQAIRPQHSLKEQPQMPDKIINTSQLNIAKQLPAKIMDDMKRPQTSKCSRRKDRQYQNNYHEADDDDDFLLLHLKHDSDQKSITKRHINTGTGNRMIFSAHPKSNSRSKPIDDLIKYNNGLSTNTPNPKRRASGSIPSSSIQSGIGDDFLDLFAKH